MNKFAAFYLSKVADTRVKRELARMRADPYYNGSAIKSKLEMLQGYSRGYRSSRHVDDSAPAALRYNYPGNFGSGKASPLDLATRENLVKTMTSGRHLPKATDYVIPSGYAAEESALIKPVNDKYIFRGGDVDVPDKQLFTSRHPDVAANYGMMRNADAYPEGMKPSFEMRRPLQAFNANQLDQVVTQESGAPPRQIAEELIKDPEYVNKINKLKSENRSTALRYPQQADRAMRLGQYNPTYETVIQTPSTPEAIPKPVGQYDARPVRLQSGLPGMALTRISGKPVPEVFGPNLIQNPPQPSIEASDAKPFVSRPKVRNVEPPSQASVLYRQGKDVVNRNLSAIKGTGAGLLNKVAPVAATVGRAGTAGVTGVAGSMMVDKALPPPLPNDGYWNQVQNNFRDTQVAIGGGALGGGAVGAAPGALVGGIGGGIGDIVNKTTAAGKDIRDTHWKSLGRSALGVNNPELEAAQRRVKNENFAKYKENNLLPQSSNPGDSSFYSKNGPGLSLGK